MVNKLVLFFDNHPEIKKIWYIPTKLNILHEKTDYDDYEYVVYDPITSIELQRTCIRSHAENFAEGFLSSLKWYATGKISSQENDGSEDYEAYLAGIMAGNELCSLHLDNGGTFQYLGSKTV